MSNRKIILLALVLGVVLFVLVYFGITALIANGSLNFRGH